MHPRVASASVHIEPSAIVETGRIGPDSRIGAYSVVRREVEIGPGCHIGDHTVLEGAVYLGAGVEIAARACLRGPLRVGNAVRVAAGACIDAAAGPETVIQEGVTIGAQATVWPGVTIGKQACVEPGTVVSKNVPAASVVAGNPARIVGYRGTTSVAAKVQRPGDGPEVAPTEVRGVTIHHLPMIEDLRGNLTFGEALRHVPFAVQRYFLTFDVGTEEARGEHAHLALHQFLIAVHGRVHIVADDGRNRVEFILERPDIGIHIPPMIWSVQYRFSAGAVLLGLCSDNYDPADYIRDYAEFLTRAGAS